MSKSCSKLTTGSNKQNEPNADNWLLKDKLLYPTPLHFVTTAISVRVWSGKRQAADDAFAQMAEQLGRFYLLEVGNLDEAIAVTASTLPSKKGAVGMRPWFPLPEVTRTANLGPL